VFDDTLGEVGVEVWFRRGFRFCGGLSLRFGGFRVRVGSRSFLSPSQPFFSGVLLRCAFNFIVTVIVIIKDCYYFWFTSTLWLPGWRGLRLLSFTHQFLNSRSQLFQECFQGSRGVLRAGEVSLTILVEETFFAAPLHDNK